MKTTFFELKLEQGEKAIVAQVTPDGMVQKTEEEKEESDDNDLQKSCTLILYEDKPVWLVLFC